MITHSENEGKVIKTYRCKRCFATRQEYVDPDHIKKTIKCTYCDTGRMRLDDLLPATGFRTKTQRRK